MNQKTYSKRQYLLYKRQAHSYVDADFSNDRIIIMKVFPRYIEKVTGRKDKNLSSFSDRRTEFRISHH